MYYKIELFSYFFVQIGLYFEKNLNAIIITKNILIPVNALKIPLLLGMFNKIGNLVNNSANNAQYKPTTLQYIKVK